MVNTTCLAKEFEGQMWVLADSHILAINEAYEEGKRAGAKIERAKCIEICQSREDKAWNDYKDSDDRYDFGYSDGAAECAIDIMSRDEQ